MMSRRKRVLRPARPEGGTCSPSTHRLQSVTCADAHLTEVNPLISKRSRLIMTSAYFGRSIFESNHKNKNDTHKKKQINIKTGGDASTMSHRISRRNESVGCGCLHQFERRHSLQGPPDRAAPQQPVHPLVCPLKTRETEHARGDQVTPYGMECGRGLK